MSKADDGSITDEASQRQRSANPSISMDGVHGSRQNRTKSQMAKGMAPTAEDSDEDLEPEWEYPSRFDRNATYIWPRLGSMAEGGKSGWDPVCLIAIIVCC